METTGFPVSCLQSAGRWRRRARRRGRRSCRSRRARRRRRARPARCRPTRTARLRPCGGVQAQHAAVVRAEVEAIAGNGDVGAEAVEAGRRVARRQAHHRLVDHAHPPALLAAGRVERVEEAVVGLEVERSCATTARLRIAPPAGNTQRFVPVAASSACIRPSSAPAYTTPVDEGRARPERSVGVERPRRLGGGACGSARGKVEPIDTLQRHRQLVDGSEALGDVAAQRREAAS